MDPTLQTIKDLIQSLVAMMKSCEFYTLGISFTLWDLFYWTFLGGVLVFLLNKILDN